MQPKPIVLIILDGFGIRAETHANAIAKAHTPTWDRLWHEAPHTTLIACGTDVGLPEGQMGNSEVGHLTIGAGRIVQQDLTRIDQSIQNGHFQDTPNLTQLFDPLKHTQHPLHVLGLLSPGGVHSSEAHIHALLRTAAIKGIPHIFIHAFLDGRDTPPKSAQASLLALKALCKDLQLHFPSTQIKIGSLCGRYYAMDRDNRFERTEMAYQLLTAPSHDFDIRHSDPIEALEAAYQRGETDEFIRPIRLDPNAFIQNKDAVVFMNFRSDRARQLSYALSDPSFKGFQRKEWPKLSRFNTLTEYDSHLKAHVLFPPQSLEHMLGELLEEYHLRQLRIAETEKYAHVTFFFNGGREKPFEGEDRILIPSPKVATYDEAPAMSAIALTDALIKAIESKTYDLIICNYANADMVGHTGNFTAAVKAIEALDHCLSRVLQALEAVQGEAIITADHGNAECMIDPITEEPHTAHTHEPVPFVYIGKRATLIKKIASGKLYDIAPTLLTLLRLPIPKEMTGTKLLKLRI